MVFFVGQTNQEHKLQSETLPIGSMYAIYGNIYHQNTPNVGIYIYIPYMNPMGHMVYWDMIEIYSE